MIRRDFIKTSTSVGLGSSLGMSAFLPENHAHAFPKAIPDREYWIQILSRLTDPVLKTLSEGKLKASMPVEAKPGQESSRAKVSHLEAFGRLMAGISPWLALGKENSDEGKRRAYYLDLSLRSLSQAVNPSSPDYMNFTQGGQPLVDAAFLGHAIVRAPEQLGKSLDADTRQKLIQALKSTRSIKPGYNNWLLFSAMVETALFVLGEDYDKMRVDYALKQHLAWYKGDGCYGDGPNFHFDYYNSYVIQPMLLDVVKTLGLKEPENLYELLLKRAQRFAEIQERLISPEGTFPAVGRSLAYRFGAFQLLAQIALMKKLPEGMVPAQVRTALSTVIKRMIEAPGTFDKNGWLTIGFCGHQPNIGEPYISTGSLYLCSVGLLPLGLPSTDEFWTAPAIDWTAKKVWAGIDMPTNSALYD